MIAERFEKLLNDVWEAVKAGEAPPDRWNAAVNTVVREMGKLHDLAFGQIRDLKAQLKGAAPTGGADAPPAEAGAPAGAEAAQGAATAPPPSANGGGGRKRIRLAVDGTPLSPEDQAQEEAMDAAIIGAGGQPQPASYTEG